ncbi:hypothetical protein [Streptomyces sp. MJM1172]|uniref:hypothetical protein n=1 Tax=Streptomyces sp. MJM1172 TaxID=1703926 RepID=UPI00095929DF|nr:hypothetical protein [Streptomyces sp. MJM1172]OKI50328.1 hypothetical protein AMK15_32750 [Streptomyces sp. MJM1172]
MSQGTEGTSDEARQLLEAEAEAERRGVSGTELLDQLAREGRRPAPADIDPQGDLTQWTDRDGRQATIAAEPLPLPAGIFDGADSDVVLGPMGSGKTNAADLTRAQLDAAGTPYVETTKTTEFDVEYIEFAVERPESTP